MVSAERTSVSKLFQTVGAADEKRLAPTTVWEQGIMSIVLDWQNEVAEMKCS